jgi:acyl-CoA reductase-like NAD-dependent aldehyde dehydrogenase
MKKLILLGLAVLSLQLTAQEKRSELQKMTPEQKTALQVKQMTLDLDLNAEQQKKVATIMEAQTKERMVKIDALKAKKDKGEKISADERYQLMNEHLDNQIELKSKLKSVLTEEQMQKWEAKQEKMKSKMANRKRKAATKK